MMTEFPLSPRQSRIIVEAILNYPDVTGETIIAAAFLSTQSPYVLPPDQEIDARRAHHYFRDNAGDFVSYLKLFYAYKDADDKMFFCEKNYLDEKAMSEIENVVAQLEIIVSDMGVPILSGGPVDDYLYAVARGLIQFVCVRQSRDVYRSLTADRILIHPVSVMFKMDPKYIVAGEIIRTARMYASSVSPLSEKILERLGGEFIAQFGLGPAKNADKAVSGGMKSMAGARDLTNNIRIADEIFTIGKIKGKKRVMLPWERLSRIKDEAKRLVSEPEGEAMFKGRKGCITLNDEYRLLEGENLSLILRLSASLEMEGAEKREWRRKEFSSEKDLPGLLAVLPIVLTPAPWKTTKKDLGFIGLTNNGAGVYHLTCSRGFHSALNESLASLESLIDEMGEVVDIADKNIVNQTFRRLSDYLA